MAEPLGTVYGKDAVSVYRTDGERLFAAEVRLLIGEEAFVPSYTEGDNSLVVATDSMKNFIQKTALEYEGESLEDLLRQVGERFLERYDHVGVAELRARELVFARREGVVFQRLYDDYATAWVLLPRGSAIAEQSGRKGLHLVKLSGSSFADFVRDEYTTLPDSRDRPLFVHLEADWRNADPAQRADGLAVRDSFVQTFADFESASIQHLVHEMGVRVLEQFPGIAHMSFEAENRLWDTAQSSDSAIVYTDARPPFGVIELSLKR
jgi:urate oxidase / 2-oxo-4-hydroxy-4-carboxy-5-ureidoimidazoline decarboxylase